MNSLLDLDQSTLANLTAALEYVCRKLPPDRDNPAIRKYIAGELVAMSNSICARDTRLAGSVRDRERAVNLSISSFVIANSTARRHPAMMPLLVSPTAKQGIRHQTIGSMMQVSWTRSSRISPSGSSPGAGFFVSVQARGSKSGSRCPLKRLAAKPPKSSSRRPGAVSDQQSRSGANSPTVRLNLRYGISGGGLTRR